MDRSQRIYRSNMRGLRKCPSCTFYNGSRAKGCSNQNCPLYFLKQEPKVKLTVDAVQLVSLNDTKFYSVRTKERDMWQRNFVQITDITLASDQDGSIVSRNAICYVDTCKYDSTDLSISCKHVKGSASCTRTAQELKISGEVLYNMKVAADTKDSLWSSYNEDKDVIPSVQRINRTTFVVKCAKSTIFPAGRLHVTAFPDDEADFKYSCSCKKLKISLSSDNSVVLENDVCDHLLMILAGFLSSKSLHKQFQNYLNALSPFWVQEQLTFADNFLTNNEDFPDFPESILSSDVGNIFPNDPSMNGDSGDNEENIVELIDKVISADETTTTNQLEECLELIDCQIELMDQFQLTNQIDLSSEEIEFCETELFKDNGITCNINEVVTEAQVTSSTTAKTVPHIALTEIKLPKRRRNAKISSYPAVFRVDDIPTSSPSLEFEEWLSFVIEQLNASLDITPCKARASHNFNIRNDFFTYLSRKFSIGEKRRIPNATIIIQGGKLKGLTKSIWIFTTPSAIKRIFSNNQGSILMQRNFIEEEPGTFISYDCEEDTAKEIRKNPKEKKILPTLFTVFINLNNKIQQDNKGFLVEWIPNVYPKSRFGSLRIEYNLGFKKNNKLIEDISDQLL